VSAEAQNVKKSVFSQNEPRFCLAKNDESSMISDTYGMGADFGTLPKNAIFSRKKGTFHRNSRNILDESALHNSASARRETPHDRDDT
jgi:hypothetical protein